MIKYMALISLWAASAQAQEPAAELETEVDAEQAETEAPPPVPQTQAFTLNPAKSKIYVVVFNDSDRWTPITGHDHAMSPSTFDGKVSWNVADASACDVQISFPATALVVDRAGFREHGGLSADGIISDGQKGTVVKNMLGKHVLNNASFPQISFKSSSCDGAEGSVTVKGSLTIHGIGVAVSAPMTVKVDGDTFSASGSFTLNHGDFGMKPYTMGPGTPKNQEKLKFVVDVVGNAT